MLSKSWALRQASVVGQKGWPEKQSEWLCVNMDVDRRLGAECCCWSWQRLVTNILRHSMRLAPSRVLPSIVYTCPGVSESPR
jgi:hypothetical protein